RLALTWPARLMAPPNSSSFSVRVVLPASGWEMMAKVRRRATSTASGETAEAAVTAWVWALRNSFMRGGCRRSRPGNKAARPVRRQLFGQEIVRSAVTPLHRFGEAQKRREGHSCAGTAHAQEHCGRLAVSLAPQLAPQKRRRIMSDPRYTDSRRTDPLRR